MVLPAEELDGLLRGNVPLSRTIETAHLLLQNNGSIAGLVAQLSAAAALLAAGESNSNDTDHCIKSAWALATLTRDSLQKRDAIAAAGGTAPAARLRNHPDSALAACAADLFACLTEGQPAIRSHIALAGGGMVDALIAAAQRQETDDTSRQLIQTSVLAALHFFAASGDAGVQERLGQQDVVALLVATLQRHAPSLQLPSPRLPAQQSAAQSHKDDYGSLQRSRSSSITTPRPPAMQMLSLVAALPPPPDAVYAAGTLERILAAAAGSNLQEAERAAAHAPAAPGRGNFQKQRPEAQCAQSQQVQERCFETGVIFPLVAMLASASADLAAASAGALRWLALGSGSHAAAIIDASALPLLLRLCHQPDADSSAAAACAVAALSNGGNGPADSVVAAGAIPVLLALLAQEGAADAARAAAASAIAGLAAGDSSAARRRQQLAAAGAVPPLAALLAGRPSNAVAQAAACALGEMAAGSVHVRDQIASWALNGLVRLVERAVSSPVAHAAVNAAFRLVSNGMAAAAPAGTARLHCAMLVDAGAVPPLVRLLRSCHPGTAARAANLMTALAGQSEAAARQNKANGGVKILKELQKSAALRDKAAAQSAAAALAAIKLAAPPSGAESDDEAKSAAGHIQSNFCTACGQSVAGAGMAEGAKLKACAGCLAVRYCSPACQQSDWPAHKTSCNAEVTMAEAP